MAEAVLEGIFRYPVKGLSPEPLARVDLAVGRTLPGDRAYAIENGPSGFDPAAPRYFPKTRFLMLMRDESLARLRTRYTDATGVLRIEMAEREVVRGDLRTAAGRASVEEFFAKYCASDLRGRPRVLHAEGFSFSDVAAKVVSIINLASLDALAKELGEPIDPLRFRANLYVRGWPAWSEFDLLEHDIAIGATARVKAVKRIVRCAATNVDPRTGQRNLAIPDGLRRAYGHADCGIYATVVAAGPIARGDRLEA